MVTDNEIDQRVLDTLASFAGDERMKSLFIWGAYTDRRAQQCECCGTPIVLVEFAGADDFPTTWARWMEIKQDNGPNITDLVFYDHEPDRCRSLRNTTRR